MYYIKLIGSDLGGSEENCLTKFRYFYVVAITLDGFSATLQESIYFPSTDSFLMLWVSIQETYNIWKSRSRTGARDALLRVRVKGKKICTYNL